MANFGFIWPQIDAMEDAKKAAHVAAGTAFLVAAVTGVITVLSMRGIKLFPGIINASSLLDAGLFLFIGFFIWRYSRLAAIAGLLLYAGEQIMMMKMTGFRFNLVPIFFTLNFISGVRGTFDYHVFRRAELQEVKQVPQQIFTQVKEVPKKKPFLPAMILIFLTVLAGAGAWYILIYAKKQPQPLRAAAGEEVSKSVATVSDTPARVPSTASGQVSFKMKDGKTISGRILMEEDVYYTVETSGGRQEIVIKEDIVSSQ